MLSGEKERCLDRRSVLRGQNNNTPFQGYLVGAVQYLGNLCVQTKL